MGKKGITLAQTLLVIVVMGIVATFAVPLIGDVIHNTQVKVDSGNVDNLNYHTERYAEYNQIDIENVFDGLVSDEQRLQFLLDEGMIEHPVRPQQDGAYFTWNDDTNLWLLVGGEYNGVFNPGGNSYTFSSNDNTIEELQDSGVRSINFDRWDTTDEGLTNTTGETRMFVPISSSSSYTITSSATLGTGSSGGYGIFFDTFLENDNVDKDQGYVFQFDRGYGTGAFIVRPRSNGRESGAVFVKWANDIDGIPNKYEDPDWWTQTHSVKISVSDSGEGERTAEFYIDGVKIGEMTYDNDIEGHQIYTGYRGWGSSTSTFYSLKS